MKLLGRRSLSSFFKVLHDVSFYVTGLAIVVVASVAVTTAVRGNTRNVSMNLPVNFAIDPSAYQIQGGNAAPVKPQIDKVSGNLTVYRPTMAAFILPLAGVLGLLCVALVVIDRMRRIFRRLVEGRPF